LQLDAVSFLSSRRDVEPKWLAILGFSMGSFISAIACAIETRVNSCVLVDGGNLDGPGGYWDASGHKMCQAIPYQSLMFLGDRGAVLYDLAAERGGTFIMNGTADPVVAEGEKSVEFFEELHKRSIALHGSEKNVFEFAFEPSSGYRFCFLTRTAAGEAPGISQLDRRGKDHRCQKLR
jgi:pimeloyl-ACP methyl ester carboxylesterase